MIDSPEIIQLIENSSLFRGISRELLDPIFRDAKVLTLKQGERLLSPGTINEHVYIIISGRMSVQVTPSLLDIPIAILSPGECVGEMSVLVDGLVSAYVIATTNCELIPIDYSSFWSLIDGSNDAARNILNILVKRIRLGNEVISDSLLHNDSHPDNDIIDKLTGLYNYHGIHVKFDRLLHRCVTGNQSLCLVALEIDGFDQISDSVGKAWGDQSLRNISQTMLSYLRPDDHAARLIGKKFVVLLADLSLQDACATTERLRIAISQTPIILPNGNTLPPFTISAGVCAALPNDTWNTLIERADSQLAQAINTGRNCVAHD